MDEARLAARQRFRKEGSLMGQKRKEIAVSVPARTKSSGRSARTSQ